MAGYAMPIRLNASVLTEEAEPRAVVLLRRRLQDTIPLHALHGHDGGVNFLTLPATLFRASFGFSLHRLFP